MKYLKKFENDNTQYSVGDKVICINDEDYKNLKNGNPYQILRTYDIMHNNNFTEYYVDVIDLKTGEHTTSVYSHRFITELEHDIKKYNL